MIIHLKTINGVKIQCSENENKLLSINEDISISKIIDRELDQMRSVILNDQLVYPKLFYTEYFHLCKNEHASVFKNENIRHDITIMSGNLAGIEFMKTYGHYHEILEGTNHAAPEVIEILHGNAIILLQKPERLVSDKPGVKTIADVLDFGNITEVSLFKLKPGDLFIVPPYYGHTIINQKSTALVFSTLISAKAKTIYKGIYDYKGASYYIIKKNAKQVFVQNPNYKNVPKIKKQKKWSYNNIMDNKKGSSYLNFINNPKNYSWINDPDSINWEQFA
jgi:glucose-6-phosphate isomerase